MAERSGYQFPLHAEMTIAAATAEAAAVVVVDTAEAVEAVMTGEMTDVVLHPADDHTLDPDHDHQEDDDRINLTACND